jgi:hypothetical protein
MSSFYLECIDLFKGEFEITTSLDVTENAEEDNDDILVEKFWALELVSSANQQRLRECSAVSHGPSICVPFRLDVSETAGLLKGSYCMRLSTRTRETYSWGSAETSSLTPVEFWGPLQNVTFKNWNFEAHWRIPNCDLDNFSVAEYQDFVTSLANPGRTTEVDELLAHWKVYLIFLAKISTSCLSIPQVSPQSISTGANLASTFRKKLQTAKSLGFTTSKSFALGVALTGIVGMVILYRRNR